VATLPDSTLPKAKNLDLSVVGTILEIYNISGPLGSQFFMAEQTASSLGPSYKYSALYFMAYFGDGK